VKTGWKFVGYNQYGAKYYTRYIDHLHAELVHKDIEDFIKDHDDIHHVEATVVYFPESIGQEDK
jgi:hypothetical protein